MIQYKTKPCILYLSTAVLPTIEGGHNYGLKWRWAPNSGQEAKPGARWSAWPAAGRTATDHKLQKVAIGDR